MHDHGTNGDTCLDIDPENMMREYFLGLMRNYLEIDAESFYVGGLNCILSGTI